MPTESLRFLHASHLRLGEQIAERCRIPKSHKNQALDASYDAFECLVETAISAQVEFVLLTGMSFDPAHLDLRTEHSLTSGMAVLSDAGIRVFVRPSGMRETAQWKQFSLTENVIFLEDALDAESVAVVRDGRLLATLIPNLDAAPSTESRKQSQADFNRSRGIRIGFLPSDRDRAGASAGSNHQNTSSRYGEKTAAAIQAHQVDYVACNVATSPETHHENKTCLHSPGAAIGLCFDESEAGSVSLIEVDSDRIITCRSQKVSPIDWSECRLRVETTSGDRINRDAFVQEAGRRLEKLIGKRAHNDAPLTFVRWRLTGHGALVASRDRELQNKVFAKARDIRKQLDQLAPLFVWDVDAEQSQASVSRLGEEFLELLRQRPGTSEDQLRTLIAESGGSSPEFRELMLQLLPKLRGEVVTRKVEQLGQIWFSQQADRGAA